MMDLVIEKELVVGHSARRLSRATDKATHHWEIFLYSPTGEDLTKWVKKCVFKLHHTFENPERTCTQEPYRVSEDGWGEFDAQIEVYPKSAIPFTLVHVLAFPANHSKKGMLIQKRHEKVVFRNPPLLLYEGLTAAAFTWSKFKRIRNQPNGDAEIIEEPSGDEHLEKKWLETVSRVSGEIRGEVRKLSEKHKAQIERIQGLLADIGKYSPDIAEAASLFL